MKEMVKYGLTLSLICILASGALAAVNLFTKPKILAQAVLEEEASLKEVIPLAVTFEPVKSGGEIIYYKALDKNRNLIAAAFKASAKGYSSTIETMSGMLIDGTITNIKVISQNETPGLGARITEPAFTSQFTNKKDLSDVQAITGATISSTAVIVSVKEKAEEIRKLIKNGK